MCGTVDIRRAGMSRTRLPRVSAHIAMTVMPIVCVETVWRAVCEAEVRHSGEHVCRS